MSTKTPVTLERLKKCLHYDPATGLFTWLIKTSRKTVIGTIAGCESKGYIIIRLDGTIYRANRLAWFYMTGEWPADDVDHKDTVRSNDRWANLREATRAQNLRNSKAHKDSQSPFKGVTRAHQPGERWTARIWVAGRMLNLGTFDTPELASAAYAAAAKEHFGEFARAA